MRRVQEHDGGNTPPNTPQHVEQQCRARANNQDDDDGESACEE
jgi:hypothetical protein